MGPFHSLKRWLGIAVIVLGFFLVVMFLSGNGDQAGATVGNLLHLVDSFGDTLATFTEALNG